MARHPVGRPRVNRSGVVGDTEHGLDRRHPMEPLLIILVPGLLGGLVLALVIAGHRQRTPPTFVPRRLAAPSPALINMAHIRIEAVGGPGMVAADVTVAIAD